MLWRQTWKGLFLQLFGHQGSRLANLSHHSGKLFRILQGLFDFSTLILTLQLTQGIGCQSRIFRIDTHLILLIGVELERDQASSFWRTVLSPVWSRKPTLLTERWVTSLISR